MYEVIIYSRGIVKLHEKIFKTFLMLFVIVYVLKIVVWGSIEIDLFRRGMAKFCGREFAYGVTETSVNWVYGIVVVAIYLAIVYKH